MRRLRKLWNRLEVLGILGWLVFAAGCSNTIRLAQRIPPEAACHKRASDIIQVADNAKPHWCKDAETAARAEPSCQSAYPEGIDFGCKEVP